VRCGAGSQSRRYGCNACRWLGLKKLKKVRRISRVRTRSDLACKYVVRHDRICNAGEKRIGSKLWNRSVASVGVRVGEAVVTQTPGTSSRLCGLFPGASRRVGLPMMYRSVSPPCEGRCSISMKRCKLLLVSLMRRSLGSNPVEDAVDPTLKGSDLHQCKDVVYTCKCVNTPDLHQCEYG